MDPIYIALGAVGIAVGVWISRRTPTTPSTTAATLPPVWLPNPADRAHPTYTLGTDVLPNITRELIELHALHNAPCAARVDRLATIDGCLASLVRLMRAGGEVPNGWHVPDPQELSRRLREAPGDLLVDLYVWRNYYAASSTPFDQSRVRWLGFLRGAW